MEFIAGHTGNNITSEELYREPHGAYNLFVEDYDSDETEYDYDLSKDDTDELLNDPELLKLYNQGLYHGLEEVKNVIEDREVFKSENK